MKSDRQVSFNKKPIWKQYALRNSMKGGTVTNRRLPKGEHSMTPFKVTKGFIYDTLKSSLDETISQAVENNVSGVIDPLANQIDQVITAFGHSARDNKIPSVMMIDLLEQRIEACREATK